MEDSSDSVSAELESLPLTGPQKRELDRRMAEHEADPSTAIPWEEFRERLRVRFG